MTREYDGIDQPAEKHWQEAEFISNAFAIKRKKNCIASLQRELKVNEAGRLYFLASEYKIKEDQRSLEQKLRTEKQKLSSLEFSHTIGLKEYPDLEYMIKAEEKYRKLMTVTVVLAVMLVAVVSL